MAEEIKKGYRKDSYITVGPGGEAWVDTELKVTVIKVSPRGLGLDRGGTQKLTKVKEPDVGTW